MERVAGVEHCIFDREGQHSDIELHSRASPCGDSETIPPAGLRRRKTTVKPVARTLTFGTSWMTGRVL